MSEDLEEMIEENEDDCPFDADDEVKVEKEVVKSPEGLIQINKEKFSTFLSVLQIIKYPTCQDTDINGGVIRQFNDRKSNLIHIDLRNILGDINLKISGVAQKYDMLESFKKQNVDVVAQVTENTYAFMDDISRLNFHQGIGEYIQNPFLSEESFNNKVPCGKRIFEKVLGKTILERISIYSKSLGSEVIKIKFDKTKAHFELSAGDGASPSVASVLSIEDELEETNISGYTSIPVDPFLFCYGGGITELSMELFHKKKKEGEFIVKLNGKLSIGGTDNIIPISIYMLSLLRNSN